MALKEIAINAAMQAGKIMMEFRDKDKEIHTKSSPIDFVSDIDIKCQEEIVRIIKEEYPDHNFLAEENLMVFTESPYRWIIDPIDGTTNYIQGKDGFCASIGLEKNDELVLGVIYIPVFNLLFVAETGKGVTCNGEKIEPNPDTDLNEVIITLGSKIYSKVKDILPKGISFKFQKNIELIGFKNGSLATEICFVACGKLGGMIRSSVKPWDGAAGYVIAKEAGLKITNWKGEEWSLDDEKILVANLELHEKLLRLINHP